MYVFKILRITKNISFDHLVEIYGNVVCVGSVAGMFYSSEFNGNISAWDMSAVTNMSYMCSHSNFNITQACNWLCIYEARQQH